MKRRKADFGLAPCEKSLSELKDTLGLHAKFRRDAELEGALMDAVVKRFEVAFEYVWKLMKAAAEYQGSEAPGPRPAIQEAVRYGWIDDPDFWAEALDARNGSVHDYFGVSEKRYLEIATQFMVEATDVIARIGKL